jgi:hypothetical protein
MEFKHVAPSRRLLCLVEEARDIPGGVLPGVRRSLRVRGEREFQPIDESAAHGRGLGGRTGPATPKGEANDTYIFMLGRS